MSRSINIFLKKILLISILRLILLLVVYLKDIGVSVWTMVLPKLSPIPVWWPLISWNVVDMFVFGIGGNGVLLFPMQQSRGFVRAKLSLMYELSLDWDTKPIF